MIAKVFTAISFAIFSLVRGQTCLVDDAKKVSCSYTDESTCFSAGCCWHAPLVKGNMPQCYQASGSATSYRWVATRRFYTLTNFLYVHFSLTKFEATDFGYSGILQLSSVPNSIYGEDIPTLRIDVFLGDESHARVKITDASAKRFEVPQSIVDRSSSMQSENKSPSPNSLYSFTYTKSPFTFTITRKSDSAILFTSSEELVFKDQYIQLSSNVVSDTKTFGLGESTRLEHALLSDRTYTLWAADIGASNFNVNLYGAYPFYLQLLNGTSHGALLMNSNGMDVTLLSNSLIFKTTGGIIDLYVFSGPTPKDVVFQYTYIVGRPAMVS
jgi:alpha-glucosidase (family GH31 glycosyl hydrolase)